jgi:NADH-quinone oxidoreductase subunit C
MSEPTRLPTADAAAGQASKFIDRREQAKAAAERRVARERALADQVAGWFDAQELRRSDFRNQFTLTLPLARAKETLRRCRDELGFAMLTDVTAIDTMRLPGEHPERFLVSWSLANLDQEARLFLQAYVNEDEPVAPTASDIWPAADWAEREVYDMFGIEFEGHPNMIRLLMPFDYAGHPLRKDYPLRGRGERDNFPVVRRANEEKVHP